jgi:hypothetical protein
LNVMAPPVTSLPVPNRCASVSYMLAPEGGPPTLPTGVVPHNPVGRHGRALLKRLADAGRVEDGDPMKITPWYLAALAPFAAVGYSGAYLGHAVVVALTVGIFLGTLSLGGAPTPPEPPSARAS